MYDLTRRGFLRNAAGGMAAATLAATMAPVWGAAHKAKAEKSHTKDKSGKKGITSASKTRNETLKAHWCYNWSPKCPDDVAGTGAEFVPMIYRGDAGTAAVCQQIKADKDTYKHLLGYNEPDKGNQAHMSVKEAIEYWPKLMETGLPLGSPAVAMYHGPWIREFMNKVKERKLRVDFLTVHHYGDPDEKGFISLLEELHKKFDRPLWLTEFAVVNKHENHDQHAVVKFLEKVLPKLEKMDFVQRYAWFGITLTDANRTHKGACSALFDKDGQLTPVGKFYASI